jgi:hypothetical protein
MFIITPQQEFIIWVIIKLCLLGTQVEMKQQQKDFGRTIILELGQFQDLMFLVIPLLMAALMFYMG